MKIPVRSPIALSPPVLTGNGSPSDDPAGASDCRPSNQRYEMAARVLVHEFPELYGTWDTKLRDLGYLDASRPYFIRRLAEDLRSIWLVSGLSGSVCFGFVGPVPLPGSVTGDVPPESPEPRILAGWPYRRSAIQYLQLQGGPRDEDFYREVYSAGIAGYLSPL